MIHHNQHMGNKEKDKSNMKVGLHLCQVIEADVAADTANY
jgi:hypothetical protein